MLWAVTSYFNPLGYRRRLENYREFRRRLGVPLIAVELAYGDPGELAKNDAEILVRLSGRDVLWQKERLLNQALSRLPPECSAVACVDCDVVFERPGWAEEVLELLRRHQVVQPFSRVHYLGPERVPGGDLAGVANVSQLSGAKAFSGKAQPGALLETFASRLPGAPSLGFAWAYRRGLLERHGLFDGGIVGGGDTAIAFAAYGWLDELVGLHWMNPRQEHYYRAWAEPFFAGVRASVHWAEGDLYHLWHGRMEDRRPRQRHADLRRFDFDPYTDIALDAGGSWRWNSDKPQLHAYLRDYFAARREDG
jgi:hypothetical protein